MPSIHTRPWVSILLRQPFGSQRPRKVELRGLSPFFQIAGIPPACLNCKSGSQKGPWSGPGGQKVGHRLWQSVGCVERKAGSILDQASPQAQLPEPALPPDLLPPKTIPLMSQGGHRLHTATMQPARLPNPPLPPPHSEETSMSGYGFIISELAQPISNYKTLFLFFFLHLCSQPRV